MILGFLPALAFDMRMDRDSSMTARDIVNDYSEMELFRVIKDYGEEQFAKNIAKHIVRARNEKPIETTGELNEIIKAAIPAKMREHTGHPSKKTYQAIRIELNHELTVLENSLDTMIELLNPKGRLSIITFHSLEDRIVKNIFRKNMNPAGFSGMCMRQKTDGKSCYKKADCTVRRRDRR